MEGADPDLVLSGHSFQHQSIPLAVDHPENLDVVRLRIEIGVAMRSEPRNGTEQRWIDAMLEAYFLNVGGVKMDGHCRDAEPNGKNRIQSKRANRPVEGTNG